MCTQVPPIYTYIYIYVLICLSLSLSIYIYIYIYVYIKCNDGADPDLRQYPEADKASALGSIDRVIKLLVIITIIIRLFNTILLLLLLLIILIIIIIIIVGRGRPHASALRHARRQRWAIRVDACAEAPKRKHLIMSYDMRLCDDIMWCYIIFYIILLSTIIDYTIISCYII